MAVLLFTEMVLKSFNIVQLKKSCARAPRGVVTRGPAWPNATLDFQILVQLLQAYACPIGRVLVFQ